MRDQELREPTVYGNVHAFGDIDNIRQKSGWFLGLGIFLVILGIAAISYAFYTTLFSVILFGFLIFGAGVIQTIQSFMARKWSGLLLSLLLGILYLVVGLLCIVKPAQSAVSLTLLIAAFCLVGGLFRMLSALFVRFNHWGWVFINGLITFILGILIFAEWPISGLWIIGLFVGIDMILLGWTWIVLSLATRSLINRRT